MQILLFASPKEDSVEAAKNFLEKTFYTIIKIDFDLMRKGLPFFAECAAVEQAVFGFSASTPRLKWSK